MLSQFIVSNKRGFNSRLISLTLEYLTKTYSSIILDQMFLGQKKVTPNFSFENLTPASQLPPKMSVPTRRKARKHRSDLDRWPFPPAHLSQLITHYHCIWNPVTFYFFLTQIEDVFDSWRLGDLVEDIKYGCKEGVYFDPSDFASIVKCLS